MRQQVLSNPRERWWNFHDGSRHIRKPSTDFRKRLRDYESSRMVKSDAGRGWFKRNNRPSNPSSGSFVSEHVAVHSTFVSSSPSIVFLLQFRFIVPRRFCRACLDLKLDCELAALATGELLVPSSCLGWFCRSVSLQ